MTKGDFIGRSALVAQKESGVHEKLVAFELLQKGVPRQGFLIFSNGKEIGLVTSGNLTPTLNKGIGMGYIHVNYADEGSEILIEIRGKTVPGIVVRRPFYKSSKS
jgi:aminomethyltransferase